jgi:hypothetical protein
VKLGNWAVAGIEDVLITLLSRAEQIKLQNDQCLGASITKKH